MRGGAGGTAFSPRGFYSDLFRKTPRHFLFFSPSPTTWIQRRSPVCSNCVMCDQSLSFAIYNADIKREWCEDLQFKPRKVPSRGKKQLPALSGVSWHIKFLLSFSLASWLTQPAVARLVLASHSTAHLISVKAVSVIWTDLNEKKPLKGLKRIIWNIAIIFERIAVTSCPILITSTPNAVAVRSEEEAVTKERCWWVDTG